MPAEWAPHERTLMAWPCREELWGGQLGQAKADYAASPNAVAAFEPRDDGRRRRPATPTRPARRWPATSRSSSSPIDDSWLRDSGPIFVARRRAASAPASHFGFNSWGEKFTPYDDDAAVGGLLVERLGGRRYEAPMVLEGGSITVDGEGTLLTTEQCLLHPNRNPELTRERDRAAAARLPRASEQVVWLAARAWSRIATPTATSTSIAAFVAPRPVAAPEHARRARPSHDSMAENRGSRRRGRDRGRRLPAAGLRSVDGEDVGRAYMNFYMGNGGA